MSPIICAGSGVGRNVACALAVSTVDAKPAATVATSQPVRPSQRSSAIPDAAPDPRFDAATRVHAVRQVVQQIAGLAYGAHVSVVTTGTTIHATIDIAG